MSDQKTQAVSVFQDTDSFANAQRMVAPLAQSELVPATYRNNIPNCMIALEMANRIQMSPLMVMQNMNVIHGRPSWGSSFIIALINSCGRFEPLQFEFEGAGDARSCRAVTKRKDGTLVKGPEISVQMAKNQGWWGKSGSKWPDMTELMLSYRAAAFFGRLHCPDVLMGMQSQDEIQDVGYTDAPVADNNAINDINAQVKPTNEQEGYSFEEVPDDNEATADEMEVHEEENVSGETVPPPPPAAPGPPPPPKKVEDDDF